MASFANTLGRFLADLMRSQNHNNSSLAAVAGVSESVIRNLLKHGIDSRAKDPDPRTLRRVADALGVDAIMLFRLAGYLPPQSDANSVRAEYLADVFDELPPEKQDAVLGVLEAMSDKLSRKEIIHAIREEPHNPLAGFDLVNPGLARLMANQLMAHYQMTDPSDADRIEPDVFIINNKWKDIPSKAQERIKSLIRHKLSLSYNPTMVDPEWRE
jgi:transcriptional regulator with XRE-family HTH domain